MEIRTIIIEDEINAMRALENMLSVHCPDVKIIATADSVGEGVKLIKANSLDLLFLDVNLPDGTGFEILKKVNKHPFKVVFITAYDEYALQAIKMCALDYLMKPVKPEDLTGAIKKVQNALENEEKYNTTIETCIENYKSTGQQKKIIINTSDNMHVIEIQNILRCEASENYSNIHLTNANPIIVAKTLKEFEEMLAPLGFFRIHQSHLINLRFVASYEKKSGGHARLNNNIRLPVSKRRKEGFLKALEASTKL